MADQDGGEIVVSTDAPRAGAPREKRPNAFRRFFGAIALFVRQVFGELRKVVTPTRQELVKYTVVVLAFVVVMMALVYGLDTLFTWITQVVFGSPKGS